MPIGIDARDGKVRVSGWTEDSNIGAIDLAKRLQDLGAHLVIYTDIARDGILDGSECGRDESRCSTARNYR